MLVAALALIAISRTPENALDGRWDLILIETPEGSFGPASGNEWIEFSGPGFRGEMACFEFNGEFVATTTGTLQLGEWGWGGSCEELDPASQAFDRYFPEIAEYRVGPSGLTLESSDASVQFTYEPAGG